MDKGREEGRKKRDGEVDEGRDGWAGGRRGFGVAVRGARRRELRVPARVGREAYPFLQVPGRRL